MVLDAQTRRNLELFEGGRWGDPKASLLSVLDRTQTPMGGRLLRRWVGQPLVDVQRLARRQEAVSWFHRSALRLRRVSFVLGEISDMERLVNRVRGQTATPRDLVGLGTSLLGGLLGIGGGIALTPIFVQVFMFPAHMATATSQLVIALTSPAAIAVHLANVPLVEEFLPISMLSVGAIFGAQVGARISRRFSASWLVRTLALGLGVAGVRLILTSA